MIWHGRHRKAMSEGPPDGRRGPLGQEEMNTVSPEQDPRQAARALMRACDVAALATHQRDHGGWPLPSLVLAAFDYDGTPLLLISRLAEHTKNLAADPRAGLLFDGTGGLDDRLTGPRLSVVGQVTPSDRPGDRARVLARHPAAAAYAGFGDFGIYRLTIERCHLVAGFGRVRWIEAGDFMVSPDRLAKFSEVESAVLCRMSKVHSGALGRYATAVQRRGRGNSAENDEGAWVATGLDPDGLDLRRNGAVARVVFEQQVYAVDEAQNQLDRLVSAALAAGFA